MKKTQIFVITFMFCLFPLLTQAAGTITGVAKTSEGTVITAGQASLHDEQGEWLNTSVNLDSNGEFSLQADPGNYQVQIHPDSPGSFKAYIPEIRTVDDLTDGETRDLGNISLNMGGNISGTVTYEGDGLTNENGNPGREIRVEVHGYERNFLANGWIDWSTGQYTTRAVPEGSYRVVIIDFNDPQVYANEFYDNVPNDILPNDTWLDWMAKDVYVDVGQITENINFHIHKIVDSDERYFYSYPTASTWHTRNGQSETIESKIDYSVNIARFSDGLPIALDKITNFSVTGPQTNMNCNSSSPQVWPTYQWRAQNRDTDMLLDGDGETPYASPYMDVGIGCSVIGQIQEEGGYTLTTTLDDSQTISKTLSIADTDLVLSSSQLPPISDLQATWNEVDNTISLSWTIPTEEYSTAATNGWLQNDTPGQIRIYLYKNGLYLNSRVRIDNLPVHTNNSIVIPSKLTVLFNQPGVDQLVIEVRVFGAGYGQTRTTSRNRQAFDFDYKTDGVLTEARIIDPDVFDIDGDRKTGLAESIHALQSVINQ